MIEPQKNREITPQRDLNAMNAEIEAPQWEKQPQGHYIMRVGDERIALIPCKGKPGLWDVVAKQRPNFEKEYIVYAFRLEYAMAAGEHRAWQLARAQQEKQENQKKEEPQEVVKGHLHGSKPFSLMR